jgi:hypothetical protein
MVAVRARLPWCAVVLATTGLAPTVSYAADSPAAAGQALEAVGDYAAAAQAYERQATAARDPSGAAFAWRAAASLRSDLAQPDMAARDARQWLAVQPGGPDRAVVLRFLGNLLSGQQKWREAAQAYQLCTQPAQTGAALGDQMECRLRYGQLLEKLGRGSERAAYWKASHAYFAAHRAQAAADPHPGQVDGQILLLEAEAKTREFDALRLDGPGGRDLPLAESQERLRGQLKAKRAAFAALRAAWMAAADADPANSDGDRGSGRVRMAALTRLGDAHEAMAQAILSSWRPADLAADTAQHWQMGLEDLAYPRQQDAGQAYAAALKIADAKGFCGPDRAWIWAKLASKWPDSYPPSYARLPPVRRVSACSSQPPVTSQALIVQSQSALRQNPSHLCAWSDLALAYLALGQPGLSMRAAQQALRLGQGDAASNNLVGLVSLGQGDVTAAADAFKRAIQRDANDVAGNLNLGFVALAFADPVLARTCFERATQRAQRDPQRRLGLALALQWQAQPADLAAAEKMYTELLNEQPLDRWVALNAAIFQVRYLHHFDAAVAILAQCERSKAFEKPEDAGDFAALRGELQEVHTAWKKAQVEQEQARQAAQELEATRLKQLEALKERYERLVARFAEVRPCLSEGDRTQVETILQEVSLVVKSRDASAAEAMLPYVARAEELVAKHPGKCTRD